MYLYNAYIYTYNLGESALLCGQFVPEAIHNQVAIKLLEPWSFDLEYNMLYLPVFNILTGFVSKYFLFRDSYLSFHAGPEPLTTSISVLN